MDKDGNKIWDGSNFSAFSAKNKLEPSLSFEKQSKAFPVRGIFIIFRSLLLPMNK